MNGDPTQPRPAETDEQRRARHLDTLREIAEMGMAMLREAAEPAPAQPAEPARPARDRVVIFTRLSSVVRGAIALEARIAAGPPARQTSARKRPDSHRPDSHRPEFHRPAPDPRRTMLRDTLHKLAKSESDRAARTALCREMDARLEDELLADPEATIPPAEILLEICNSLGIPVDLSKVSDAVLGMPPRNFHPEHAALGPPPDG